MPPVTSPAICTGDIVRYLNTRTKYLVVGDIFWLAERRLLGVNLKNPDRTHELIISHVEVVNEN